MSVIFLRAIILYALIIFSVRLMGKRQIGELQPSELVITILVSNIATLPIEDSSVPMLMGIVPILTLVCLDILMSWLTLKNRRLRRIVSGTPKVIIRDGIIDQEQLKILRFSIDDLMEAIHEYNIFDISEVQFAVVETTGKISVYQKFQSQTVTPEMLKLKGASSNPPVIVIDDGILLKNALSAVKRDKTWIEEILKKNRLLISEVFLMTVTEEGSYKLVKKEKKVLRIKFCAGILLALMIFCASSLWVIKSESEKLCRLTENVKILSENEKTGEAMEACHELARFWESYYKLLSVFVKGDKLIGINASVAKIKPYLEEENEELKAELDSIIYQVSGFLKPNFLIFIMFFKSCRQARK